MDYWFPNIYFSPLKPIEGYIQLGTAPSNQYYGNARIHTGVWRKIEVVPGDEVHWLHGGLFLVQATGKVHRLRFAPPKDSAFERDRASTYLDLFLKTMVKDGRLERIEPPREKHNYNVPLRDFPENTPVVIQ